MTITDQAPYAPADSVIRVLETYRDTGLGGGAIDAAVLARLGFGEEISRRIQQAFRLLDLTDDAGVPAPNLVAFRQAGADYREILANVVYDGYAPVFGVLGKDLSGKTPEDIEHAFRTFRPASLRKRMVTLFLGLCQYVGIVDAPPKTKPGPKSGSRPPAGVKPKPPPRRQVPPAATANTKVRAATDSYTVELRSGGTVTLGVEVRLFDLTPEDRKFVIDLIDTLKGYGAVLALPPGPAPGASQN